MVEDYPEIRQLCLQNEEDRASKGYFCEFVGLILQHTRTSEWLVEMRGSDK